MAKVLPTASFKPSGQILSDEQTHQINQLLLQLAKIEFDWYQSKKETQSDCQNVNRQEIEN